MSTRGRAVAVPSTAALVLVTGVGPLGTDTYIAGLPELRSSLGISATVAQLTFTTFIVGLAVGQLLLGAISDATGRRRLLLVGAVVFTVLSAVCALAPNGAALLAARFGQGVAAGGGVVVGRAVVTDTYRGPEAAARFGTLASITFLGPIVAPALGGVILAVGSWRTVFAFLTAIGVLMTVAVLLGLPETLLPERRHAPGLRDTAARMTDLLRDRQFMQHVTVYCLSAAGFFTYIGGSAFVLQSAYDLGPSRYALLFATNAAAMAGTAVLFRALVGTVGPSRLRTAGVTASTAAAVSLLGLALADRAATGSVVLPWVLLGVVVAGTGLTVPATTALTQEAGRRAAGTAASLQGGMGFFVGALVTPLTGVLGYTSLLPMALAMTVFYLSAFTLMRMIATGRS